MLNKSFSIFEENYKIRYNEYKYMRDITNDRR